MSVTFIGDNLLLDLPISINTLSRIEEAIARDRLKGVLSALSDPEVAALMFIVKSSGLDYTMPVVRIIEKSEQILAKLINVVGRERENILTILHDHLNILSFDDHLKRLNRHSIFLMKGTEVEAQAYLDCESNWIFGWRATERTSKLITFTDAMAKQLYSQTLTTDQVRLLTSFAAETDEPMHVQGVAGSGKSKFIEMAMNHVNATEVLILAMRTQQIKALQTRLNKPVLGLTFHQLADQVIQKSPHIHIPYYWERKKIRHSLDYGTLANLMGYHPFSRLDVRRVAEAVFKTTNNFCFSADDAIGVKHIPKAIIPLLQSHEQDILAQLATDLWQVTINPTKDILLPLHGFHRLKLWALSDEGLPGVFTICFVDETHDLSSPAIQVLDRSVDKCVITLGDTYQAVGRIDQLQNRAKNMRHRIMNISYRSGRNLNGLFNMLLDKHPNRPCFEFEGSDAKATRITTYQSSSATSYQGGSCVILGRECWHLLKALLYLSEQGAVFSILEPTKNDLMWLVSDAINLYTDAMRPTHRAFYRYSDWSSYFREQSSDVQSIIQRTIGKGFSIGHLEKHVERAVGYTKDAYLLAKVEDCKNMEFSRVMLLPDIMQNDDRSIIGRTNALNLVYLGMSRALNELIIPEELEGWISSAGC